MTSQKKILLTIDDSPSPFMISKVDFLKKHQIPAVFFCRGEFMPALKRQVIYAIQQGFLIGNHSYSHPYFSQISLEKIFDEILKTETLIEECYLQAGIERPFKVIRLPFGDRGSSEHRDQIQQFLKNQGFSSLLLEKETPSDLIDVPWTWDTCDYKRKMKENGELFKQTLSSYFNNSSLETEIILLHDFKDNHSLFEITMNFLLEKKVLFV